MFATPAAKEWRRFLLAVEHPERADYVRLAATTLLVGNTVTEVAALTDEAVLDLQEKVRRWHDLLVGEGVPPLVAAVDRETGVTARVLAQPDGERTITDLTHIAEEMHAVWRRGRMGSLRAWLEAAIAEARGRAESNAEEPEGVSAVSRPTPPPSPCRPSTAPRVCNGRWCWCRSPGIAGSEAAGDPGLPRPIARGRDRAPAPPHRRRRG